MSLHGYVALLLIIALLLGGFVALSIDIKNEALRDQQRAAQECTWLGYAYNAQVEYANNLCMVQLPNGKFIPSYLYIDLHYGGTQ